MADVQARSLLPQMRLDELLSELQVRLEAVLATRDRVHALLEAVVSVGSDLELETVLRRIVETATTLVDARYGALGVVGEGNTLAQFIPVGLSEEEIARIEHWPHGLGPARPADQGAAARCGWPHLRSSRVLRLPARPPADGLVPRRADPGARRGLREPLPDREARRRRSSTRRTRPSSPPWPPPPASRSRTPACTRRPGCARSGSRRPRRSPPRLLSGAGPSEVLTLVAAAGAGDDRRRRRGDPAPLGPVARSCS